MPSTAEIIRARAAQLAPLWEAQYDSFGPRVFAPAWAEPVLSLFELDLRRRVLDVEDYVFRLEALDLVSGAAIRVRPEWFDAQGVELSLAAGVMWFVETTLCPIPELDKRTHLPGWSDIVRASRARDLAFRSAPAFMTRVDFNWAMHKVSGYTRPPSLFELRVSERAGEAFLKLSSAHEAALVDQLQSLRVPFPKLGRKEFATLAEKNGATGAKKMVKVLAETAPYYCRWNPDAPEFEYRPVPAEPWTDLPEHRWSDWWKHRAN